MEQNVRKSNIELLRIVTILMIIVHHIVTHCVNIQLAQGDHVYHQARQFYELSLLDVGAILGPIGNGIFVLVSGMFLVVRGSNVDLGKIAKKLLGQTVFAAAVLLLESSIVYQFTRASVSRFLALSDVSFLSNVNDMSWFVGYYFLIVLLGKLYLNGTLCRLSQEQYRNCLLVGLAIITFTWSGVFFDEFIHGARILLAGIWLYSLGGYMSLYHPFQKVRTIYLWLILICCGGFLVVSGYNYRGTHIEQYIMDGGTGEFSQVIAEFQNFSFIVLVTSVLICELFLRLKMKYHAWINTLAKSVFMVYLIHDNTFFYRVWNLTDWIPLLHNHTFQFVMMILLWAVGVYVIGTVIYGLYVLICGKLLKTIIC